jgi:CubicO group peptidase (beta-lactamase class C family)
MRRVTAFAMGLAWAVLSLGQTTSHAARGARPQTSSVEIHSQHIENGLSARMRSFGVPGVSIAVINDGKIEWAKGYGVLEAGGNRPVTPTTLFQAGSVSKSVAAMGALYLVEHKMLALDEDVNKRLRSWKVPEDELTREQKVTLRRLLSHSAGLSLHGFPGYPIDHAIPSLVQVLDGTRPANTPPIRVEVIPGRMWLYSGGGYTVMQQLVIDVTHRPYADFMRDTVLGKLGMQNSTFAQPLPKTLAESAATGHYPGGEKVRGRWHVYPELAAAGLWTTPSDLARFVIELQSSFQGKSNKVLSRAMTRQMLTPQIKDDGLGVLLAESGPSLRFKHGGRNEGFDSVIVGYAEVGQGAVIMVNTNVDDEFMNGLLRSLASEYHWRDFPGEPSDVATIGGIATYRRTTPPSPPAISAATSANTRGMTRPAGVAR